MKKKHQRVDHTQRRVDHTRRKVDHSQKRGGLGSLGKMVGGSREKVGNKNHLPQGSGLVEEDNRVMGVSGDCDMMEMQDG